MLAFVPFNSVLKRGYYWTLRKYKSMYFHIKHVNATQYRLLKQANAYVRMFIGIDDFLEDVEEQRGSILK